MVCGAKLGRTWRKRDWPGDEPKALGDPNLIVWLAVNVNVPGTDGGDNGSTESGSAALGRARDNGGYETESDVVGLLPELKSGYLTVVPVIAVDLDLGIPDLNGDGETLTCSRSLGTVKSGVVGTDGSFLFKLTLLGVFIGRLVNSSTIAAFCLSGDLSIRRMSDLAIDPMLLTADVLVNRDGVAMFGLGFV